MQGRDREKFKSLASTQLAVFDAKQKSIQAQLDVIDKQIRQKRVEVQALKDQVPGIKNQIKIIAEQLSIRKALSKKGLQPRLILLDTQRELARTEALLVENRGQQRRTIESVSELDSRKIEVSTRLTLEAAESLGKINGQIAELMEAISQTEDKVSRLAIRSPVEGIIQNLRTETLGGVIKAGETVAEVIPTGAELIVESRVDTGDIGFLFKGQRANVKVLTYDYTRYGEIKGVIENISATTIEDETGKPHYVAYIKLEKNYVGD